ncbi:MAG: HNH endonuclease [Bryobacterales bacterium]|nr:HNH endonuclease [Bryobacterales bacterium]
MPTPEDDARLRAAAFEWVRRMQGIHGVLETAHLNQGFRFEGDRIPIHNRQQGIFKPQKMSHLLSIKTVYPRPGARIWYRDQENAHEQIYAADETVEYAFMGRNPAAAQNRWLREAFELRIPVIYFLGIAPGKYQAIVPAFIAGWDPTTLTSSIAFRMPTESAASSTMPIMGQGQEPVPEISGPSLQFPGSALERRYGLRSVKQRLHQASFRAAIMAAYGGRCAVSGMPEQRLLDAAHIIPDRHEFGHPVVPNGLPLSKIHHAAFDAHLIGIDPEYGIHVSERLLEEQDGPLLEALQQLHGSRIHLPKRSADRPDPDRLAQRFDLYRAAA